MRPWSLILGASSGFGEATSLELARAGHNVFGVHLDRREGVENVDRLRAEIRRAGGEERFFNINAADDDKRTEVVKALAEAKPGPLRVVLHSLAFGSLRPYIAAKREEAMDRKRMEMTLDVMAHSFVYWVQDLASAGLLAEGSHVYAMTSAGGARVWPAYGAVSAAKAALEAHMRQLATELVPLKVAVNAIRAGVTDTPSLRKIPGHEEMIRLARERNPSRRLTEPRDVARAIVALCGSVPWCTGNVIGVDGGEFLV